MRSNTTVVFSSLTFYLFQATGWCSVVPVLEQLADLAIRGMLFAWQDRANSLGRHSAAWHSWWANSDLPQRSRTIFLQCFSLILFFFFVKLLELLSCISFFFALSYKYSKYHLNHSPIWLNFLLFWRHFSWFSQFWVILSVVYFLLYSETSMNYFLRYDPVFLYSHCFPRKISLFFLSALQVYFPFIP